MAPRPGGPLARRCAERLAHWMPTAFVGPGDPLAVEIGGDMAVRIGERVSLREPVDELARILDRRWAAGGECNAPARKFTAQEMADILSAVEKQC